MSSQLKIKVAAGNHSRRHCPVRITIPKDSVPAGVSVNEWAIQDEEGNEIALQAVEQSGKWSLHWIVNDLPAQSERVYSLSTRSGQPHPANVSLVEGENKIDVMINNRYFSSYVFDPELAKPYLGPIIGPYGDSYTRLDFETKEHPHHRSLWVAIGDVNGHDMWNEPAGRHGKQQHQRFAETLSGPVLGKITAENVWTDFKGKKQVDESRTLTFYHTGSNVNMIDADITFHAAYGQVEFGATKEAGPLGIRVAESMSGDHGGKLTNSYGGIGQGELWGQRAHWCDYYGDVNGHTLGISVFDQPENENYPSHWHIRDYGLIAPNNFHFIGGQLLKKGASVHYSYRVYFHEGDTSQAEVAERFHDYINPPKVQWVE